MNGWLLAGVAAVSVSLILLDLTRRLRLISPWCLAIYLPVALNLPLCAFFLWQAPLQAWLRWLYAVVLGIFCLYLWLRLNIFPVLDGRRLGFRLKAMIGGSPILYSHIYAIIFQLIFMAASYPRLAASGCSGWLLTLNAFYALGCCLVLFFNGILRVFLTSRRLSILRRALILLVLWIPGVNLVMWFYSARLVRDEYDFAYDKQQLEATRPAGSLCQTKYPLVLVHGVAFRDSRYFNYWGRIPRALMKNGATIYYGNQEALGTIAYNAHDIKDCIERVLAETGKEKVNIIAHSKGGLDARCAITRLDMGSKVASLTTVSTPHRGCKFVDTATAKLPEPIYRLIAKCFDHTFRKYGDRNPDFYTATKQFCTAPSAAFNEETPNVPGVYYQSYASVMKGFFSDSLLCIPYFFIKRCNGENDGLVAVDSTKWGEFRGVFRNQYRRGISHGDMIDLKREDYKDFDVVEAYIQMVADLKNKGF